MGQHTHEILRWIGKTDAEIDSLQRRGVI
jgi:hypothetical protein